MSHSPNDHSGHRQALESLAHEVNVSFEKIQRMYDETAAKLATGAKVNTYLHVFVMRELNDTLKQRKAS